jgi:hypothetical protein
MQKVLNILLISSLLLTQTSSTRLKQTAGQTSQNALNYYLNTKAKIDTSAENVYNNGLNALKANYDNTVSLSKDTNTKSIAETDASFNLEKAHYDSQVQNNENSYTKAQAAANDVYNEGVRALELARDSSLNNAKIDYDNNNQFLNGYWTNVQNQYDSLKTTATEYDNRGQAATESAYNTGVQAYKDTYSSAKAASDARQEIRQRNIESLSK